MDSVREWTHREAGEFFLRVIVLAFVWYLLWRGLRDGIGSLLDPGVGFWLAVVLANTLAIGYVVVRSRWTGWKLVGAIAFVYGGMQTVSFVEIFLYEMVTLREALTGSVTSLLTILVVATLIVAVFGKLTGDERPPPDDRLRLSARQWAWKIPVIAVVHLVAFLASGLFVFLGVAELVDPRALATYTIIEPQWWIFPFQAVRGVLFAAFMLPVIALFVGGLRETQVTVALAFAVLLSSGMVLPNSGIPGLLWVAHFAEVFVSSVVLELVVVPLVHHEHHPLGRLLGRGESGAGPSTPT